ncbi:sigma factor-like helix-turn-helix DNA-binding protein [Streptomyces sp. NPDC048629]|uniref:sigma factor-like helix-turn-helix DNA-binding protein n=1 Tax=Streptomyces sp. NPDC048629 TaxID=3154824 RepID=UPI0034168A47
MALEKTSMPVEPTERSVTAADVRRALVALSADQRAVLLHVHFRGLSVNEASRVLGVPAGTVKSRTYDALRALRQALRCSEDAA